MFWLVVLAMTLAGCQRGASERPSPAPHPTAGHISGGIVLTSQDMELYLAVKRKALSRLEEKLEELQKRGGDPIPGLGDLATLEREAAAALGADPSRVKRVQEAVTELVALKGRAEESVRLEHELQRNLQELARHAANTNDAAARQFLEAQMRALRQEIQKLQQERGEQRAEYEQLELLARYRLEMAQLEAQQNRVARKIRELISAGVESQRTR